MSKIKIKPTGEVIVAKVWQHRSGRTASVYGAVPWTGAAGNSKRDWILVERGFTIRWPDGTVGCGRPPFVTREAAQQFVEANPRFPGMSCG